MEEFHRNALLKARCVLVDQMVAEKALWSLLLERKVFTKQMLERILFDKTPHEQRQQLLDDLPRRGPDAFDKFLGILRDTKQPGLATYLEDMVRHLRQGEPQPQPPALRRPSVDRSVSRIGVTNSPDVLPGTDDLLRVQDILERNEEGLEVLKKTEGVIENQFLKPQAASQQHLEEKSTNDWEFTYKVRSSPKGQLLIISNRTFVKKSERTGTEVDCENLTRVFCNLGYQLYENKVYTDQTAEQMQEVCCKFILDEKHDKLDSCVLCILSHGDGGGVIYGSDDGSVTEDQLFEHFNSPACRLHNKPKLVIIQACRGTMKDRGSTFDQTDTSAGKDEGPTTVQKIIHSLQWENYNDTIDLKNRVELPVYVDIIFAHSTTPGFVSWRHELRGSWFIQTIAKTFAGYAHEKHVADMLTIVSRVVTETFGAKLRAVSMPHPVSRLRKDFFFFPK